VLKTQSVADALACQKEQSVKDDTEGCKSRLSCCVLAFSKRVSVGNGLTRLAGLSELPGGLPVTYQ
jgi:hypothetical protein